ncbi:MAG: barstar family protein [Pirellulales bacterium]
MAIFHGDDDYQRLDWMLLQNGAVSLYHRVEILAEDVAWLAAHGYVVHDFDCAAWDSQDHFHDAVSTELDFPGWYGRNFSAFNDCLCDIEIPDEGGCALVFRRYDHFTAREPQPAQWILEAIQDNSRILSLWGKRLLALLQSDDPRLEFQLRPVGACSVSWNRREWLNSARGL